jgi:hypothetical protein
MTKTLKSFLSMGAALALAPAATAQLSIVSNLPGTFVDISATGTPLSLADDAEVDITTTIGNALLPAGTVRVASNGGARFRGTGTELGITNTTLPNVAAFSLESQSLLPFWDDINTVSGTAGQIYWQETMGMLIVQWHDVAFFGAAGQGTARFQLQVPSTGTTWARYIYPDISQTRPNGGASATIGYQAAGWGNDVQFSFNTAGAVIDGSVLTLTGTFTPPPPPPAASCMLVSNLPGTWIDISATGTALNLTDDAEVDIATTIGNATFPAGATRVGSNGGVRFAGTGLDLGVTNLALPSTAAFSLTSKSLLGFWDDLNTVGGTVGNIYWQETQGRLIIQWQAAGFFAQPATETVTFQIQVPSGAGNIKAQFLYQDVAGIRANGGGSATIGYQAGNGPLDFAQWSFNTPGAVANGTVLSLVPIGPGTVGTNYCTANVNSTGQTGLITGLGSASVAANNLTLEASRLPLSSFGYFLTSTTQAVTPNPGGSQGILCIGGQIGRYTGPGQIKNSGATGAFSLLLNLTQIPTPTGFVPAVVGQTRYFQCWHRDAVGGNATSNFTNGLSVTFQQ